MYNIIPKMSYNSRFNISPASEHNRTLSETTSSDKEKETPEQDKEKEIPEQYVSYLFRSLSFSDNQDEAAAISTVDFSGNEDEAAAISTVDFSGNEDEAAAISTVDPNTAEDYAKRMRICFMLEASQDNRTKLEHTIDSLMVEYIAPVQIYIRTRYNDEVQEFVHTYMMKQFMGDKSCSNKIHELFHKLVNELIVKDQETKSIIKFSMFTDDAIIRLLYRFTKIMHKDFDHKNNDLLLTLFDHKHKDFFCALFCDIAKKSFHKIPNIDSLMASIAPYLSKVEIEPGTRYFNKQELEELLINLFKDLDYELRYSDFGYCGLSISESQRQEIIKRFFIFKKQTSKIKHEVQEKYNSMKNNYRSHLLVKTDEILNIKNILVNNAYLIFRRDIISYFQLNKIIDRVLRVSVAESQKHSLYLQSVHMLKELVAKSDKKDMASIALCALLFE